MKKMIALLALAPLFAAACGSDESEIATTGQPGVTTITGELTYLQRIALIPGGTATITLSDVSLQDAVAPVVAEVVIELEDRQIPIPFELTVDESDFAPGGTYALQATINGPEGNLEWTTDTTNSVDLTQSEVDMGALVLVQVDQQGDDQATGPLLGEWTVTSIDGAPTDVEPAPTLIFGEDGTLGGNASCNSFSTTYLSDGDSLTLTGEPAVTMMACDTETDAQERAFLQALNSIGSSDGATVTIEGTTLSITTADATIEATH